MVENYPTGLVWWGPILGIVIIIVIIILLIFLVKFMKKK